MIKSTRFIARALLCATTFAAPFAARAQEAAPVRPFEGITVQGMGEVRVKPDIARLNLGVQTQDKDVQVASRTNAARTQALIAAIRAGGVEERDIQTAGFSVSPQYDYRQRPNDANGTGQPILTGYQVSNEVRVVVRLIENAGRVLDAGIKAGANTAGGISFDLLDPATSRDEALRRAVAQASRKATVLSAAAGTGTLRLVALVESSSSYEPPRPMYAMAQAEAAGASTPIQAGEITVNANVTAYYAIQTR